MVLIFFIQFYITKDEKNADRGEKCASVAKALAWYNRQFTADKFNEALKNTSKYRYCNEVFKFSQ